MATNRVRRSGAQFGNAPTPTQRTQFIARDTPRVASQRAGTEGLSQAFSSFFGQAARATDMLAQADHAQNIARTAQENERQKQTGEADAITRALAGESFDPAAVASHPDMDYVTAYTKSFARQEAVNLSGEYLEALSQLPSDVDSEQFTDQWIREKLKNGDNFGTGDALFDVEVLGTFQKMTTEARVGHNLNGVKVQAMRGRQALGTEINGTLMHLETGDVEDLHQRASLLFPGEEHKAAAFVMTELLEAGGNVPSRVAKVSSLLEDSGFYDKFPDMRNTIETKLVSRYTSGQTVEGNAAYEKLSERLTALSSVADPQEAIAQSREIVLDLFATKERYGKGGQYDTQRAAAQEILTKAWDTYATFNKMNAMAAKSEPLDQSLIRKNAKAYFKAAGVDPFENPEVAATLVTGWSYTIDSDTKAEMSAALDGEDPARFGAAVRFYYGLEQNGGDAGLRDTITASHRPTYEYAKRQVLYSRRDPTEVWTDIRNGKVDHKVVSETSWGDIVPDADSVAKAEIEVNDLITSAIEDSIGGVTSISPYVLSDVRAMVKRHHLMRNKGQTDLSNTVKDVVKGVIPSLTAFPGPDGSVLVEPVQMPRTVNETDADGYPLVGPAGEAQTREVIPFGTEILNPHTGKPENTIQTFREDMSALVAAFGGSVTDFQDYDAISLDGNSAWSKSGVWLVKDERGFPAFLPLGGKFKIGGREVTIPADMGAAQEAIKNVDWTLGFNRMAQRRTYEERFRLIPTEGGFILGYTPGFKTRSPTTEERQAEWEAGAKKAPDNSELQVNEAMGRAPALSRTKTSPAFQEAEQILQDRRASEE